VNHPNTLPIFLQRSSDFLSPGLCPDDENPGALTVRVIDYKLAM
jgi:hypothetical protein